MDDKKIFLPHKAKFTITISVYTSFFVERCFLHLKNRPEMS